MSNYMELFYQGEGREHRILTFKGTIALKVILRDYTL